MRVSNINHQKSYNSVVFTSFPNAADFVKGIGSVKLAGVKKMPLSERLFFVGKWLVGLYNVRTNGEYVIKKGKVPYKLSTQTIIIPRGVQVGIGNYSATEKIVVRGDISKEVGLKSKNIVIDEFANFSGTTKSTCLNIYGSTTNDSNHFTKELHIESGADAGGKFVVKGPAYIYGNLLSNSEVSAEGVYAGEGSKIEGVLRSTKPINILGELADRAQAQSPEFVIHPGAKVHSDAKLSKDFS